jgi:CheY-like chemotaxis protein
VAAKVLLVEDVAELRGTIRIALDLRGGFEVVGEAATGADAIAAASAEPPDIVVLDLGLPDIAGQDVLHRLKEVAPDARVVVYTGTSGRDDEGLTDVAAFVQKERGVAYLVDLLGDLGREGHQTASIELPLDPANVSVARRFVRDHCEQWGCGDMVDAAELILTELVTNAFIHARSRCQIRVRYAADVLRLEVRDGGLGVPDPQASHPDHEHGRGMLLISALAKAWGVEPEFPGKLVWAELVA